MPVGGKRAAFSCKHSRFQSYWYFSQAHSPHSALGRMWGIFGVPVRYQDDGRQERDAGKDGECGAALR